MSCNNKEDTAASTAQAAEATTVEADTKESTAAAPPAVQPKQVLTVAELPFHNENAPVKEAEASPESQQGTKESGNGGLKVLANLRRSLTVAKKEKGEKKDEASTNTAAVTESGEAALTATSPKEKGPLTRLVDKVFKKEEASKDSNEISEETGDAETATGEVVVTDTTPEPESKKEEKTKDSKPFLETVTKFIGRVGHVSAEPSTEEKKEEVAATEATKAEEVAAPAAPAETVAVDTPPTTEKKDVKVKDSKPFLQNVTKFITRSGQGGESVKEETDKSAEPAKAVEEPVTTDTVKSKEVAAASPPPTDYKKDDVSPSKGGAMLGAIRKKTTDFVHSLEEKLHPQKDDKEDKIVTADVAEGESSAKDEDQKPEETKADKSNERTPAVVGQIISGIKTKLQEVTGKDHDKKQEEFTTASNDKPQEDSEANSPTSPKWKKRVSGYFVKPRKSVSHEDNNLPVKKEEESPKPEETALAVEDKGEEKKVEAVDTVEGGDAVVETAAQVGSEKVKILSAVI